MLFSYSDLLITNKAGQICDFSEEIKHEHILYTHHWGFKMAYILRKSVLPITKRHQKNLTLHRLIEKHNAEVFKETGRRRKWQ